MLTALGVAVGASIALAQGWGRDTPTVAPSESTSLSVTAPSRSPSPSVPATPATAPSRPPSPSATPKPTGRCPGTGVMAKACAAIGTADSIWVVVNKKRPLDPAGYVPEPLVVPAIRVSNGQQLRADAAKALSAMVSAAAKEGAGEIGISSAYRSYATQVTVFQNGVAKTSPTEALKWYAKPGHSEHQTGLTADLLPVGNPACAEHRCIGRVAQGRWLAANAWRFGFILRYEEGRTSVTGYNYEPWHFRFIGPELARLYHEGGFHTLEQFFGLPAAPTY